MIETTNNTYYYANPDAIRIFWGYKQDHVSQSDFNKDLGETFMPGTPAVLAPMGLNGYLPAVLNLDDQSKYPDEVALIVYPSRFLYKEARSNNLLGRIYTYSHAGVFDSVRSRGQWPGTVEEPIKHSAFERWAWRVYDNKLDWQKGETRLVAIESKKVDLYDFLLKMSIRYKDKMLELGVEELIIQCTKEFATLWFQGNAGVLNLKLSEFIADENIEFVNDINARPFIMRHGNEKVEINGEDFVKFRFPRELKYYI